MTRRCALSEKQVRSGNKVSHSNRKTRRTFRPNLKNVSLLSDALGTSVTLRISMHALRSVEHNGGLDSYLVATPNRLLSQEARDLKKSIKKKLEATKAAA